MIGRHIPWFNPRELDDETLLALSTGRDALITALFEAVRERLAHPGTFKHWLLTGARGAGKSFFLRLVQAHFAREGGDGARFVLLPEEHRNIYAPHEFLVEVRRMLNPAAGDPGAAPAWRVADTAAAWERALSDLLEALPEPLLVIGVENFDVLLEQAFADPADNARLRSLMNNQPRLMLVATAVQGDFDERYDQRLFRQFEHHPIPRWDETDHREYLARRALREGKVASALQLARIDAYSRYTGGNARAAAILAAALLDEHDPLVAASDLDAAIDSMSDYYRALIDRIPANTRKLFDALVRGGDPASQTDIATRTGARQNEIARAFAWLVDHGYVGESRAAGEKTKQYRVLDRLFVQFYRMRSIGPGQRSKLALMAELLADTIAFHDKWRYASRYAQDGEDHEAMTMAELAFRERGIDPARLPILAGGLASVLALGNNWNQHDAIADFGADPNAMKAIMQSYPSDVALKQVLTEAALLARAASRGSVSGERLVALLDGSLSICPAEKYRILVAMLNPQMTSERQWQGWVQVFEHEAEEFVRLMETEGDIITRLQEDRALGVEYPLTASLQHISESVVRSVSYLAELGLPFAADCGARAAVQWLAAGQPERASASLATCFSALQRIADAEPVSEVFLDVAARLEPALLGFPPAQQAELREWQGVALEQRGRYLEAGEAHRRARRDRQTANQPITAAWNLEKMAWCEGAMNNIDIALVHHRQAIEERFAQQRMSDAAWNLGQIARYIIVKSGVASAWHLLDVELKKVSGEEIRAIQQLGDAVADEVFRQDEAAAFALACELLQGLVARPRLPLEACLRAFWIDMVGMTVPHSLLRDLLGEWRRLFGAEYERLAPLEQLLRDWLDDLDAPVEAREKRRKTLDPDLATTLAGLEQQLPPMARLRLGLLPTPASESNESA